VGPHRCSALVTFDKSSAAKSRCLLGDTGQVVPESGHVRGHSREVPPGGGFQSAVDEFQRIAAVGANERDVGVGDGQPADRLGLSKLRRCSTASLNRSRYASLSSPQVESAELSRAITPKR
jgi:hypothetical protein